MGYEVLLQTAMSTLSDIQDRLVAEDEYAIHEMRTEIETMLKVWETMPEVYIISRPAEWTDEVWNEVVDAVEETVVAVAEDYAEEDV